MTFIITAVLSFLMAYRYFSLFVITFLAAFIIPLPSNLSVLTATSFTSQGFFNIYFVFVVALAGNVAGDLAMYVLARRYGRKTLERISFFRRIFNSPKYGEYTVKLQKYAPITIIISRFVTEVNPLVNIIAGIIPIPFFQYFKYELLGEILDVTAFILIGYFVGLQKLSIMGTSFLLILTVVCVWLAIRIFKKAVAVIKAGRNKII